MSMRRLFPWPQGPSLWKQGQSSLLAGQRSHLGAPRVPSKIYAQRHFCAVSRRDSLNFPVSLLEAPPVLMRTCLPPLPAQVSISRRFLSVSLHKREKSKGEGTEGETEGSRRPPTIELSKEQLQELGLIIRGMSTSSPIHKGEYPGGNFVGERMGGRRAETDSEGISSSSPSSHWWQNPFRIAGYSFSLLLSAVLLPIVVWPFMDTEILPRVIARALERSDAVPIRLQQGASSDSNGVCVAPSLWGRDRELALLQSMMAEDANCIWGLIGESSSGKTALIRELAHQQKGILYIDLRHFFDGNAFVFEMIDALYNMRTNGLLGVFIASYVKLFTFVTSLMATGQHQVVAMLYFHAMLNHLRAGIRTFNQKSQKKKNEKPSLPLVVFDHFESLPQAMRRASKGNKEMLSFIMYSIGQFATSVCHDHGIAHVLFIGDEGGEPASSKDGKDSPPSASTTRLQRPLKPSGAGEEEKESQAGLLREYVSNASGLCTVWTLGEVNRDAAGVHICRRVAERLGMSLSYPESALAEEIVEGILEISGSTRPASVNACLETLLSRLSALSAARLVGMGFLVFSFVGLKGTPARTDILLLLDFVSDVTMEVGRESVPPKSLGNIHVFGAAAAEDNEEVWHWKLTISWRGGVLGHSPFRPVRCTPVCPNWKFNAKEEEPGELVVRSADCAVLR
uniref:Uncharacterized protein n=1 Tax=Chromera velia CCMP2878 TaxID=1169474 RepID=A0A0G4ICJ3_9ALVE|eukprot:Cvel_13058.t1-p1 / transcript=Cvel_13058.t1 / gene=Cvel_13058 / organism=Chromera_velia_CCMP2878 / gene_product=hypothetical protein / transcript_product=hypothetical protein / location=Cvel_scaffold878:57062-63163(-) / protein_length=680 / sequence_SO=supercontig / SO=protein_coding / is_pseudo=false